MTLLEGKILLEQKLLVVRELHEGPEGQGGNTLVSKIASSIPTVIKHGHLYDERAIKGVLQPLSEMEGNEMPKVQCLGGRPPTRVQVEFLPRLVQVQQLVQVSMREKDASPQEPVHFFARNTLHALDEVFAETLGTKSVD